MQQFDHLMRRLEDWFWPSAPRLQPRHNAAGGQRPQDWKLSLSNSALERSAATATLKKHPALDTLITLDFASGHHENHSPGI